MSPIIRRWAQGDVEIRSRAVVYDTTEADQYENELALRRDLPGRLAAWLQISADEVVEYRDPRSGVWKNLLGEPAQCRSPHLARKEVLALRSGVSCDAEPVHGEAPGWIGFDNRPEDVLEAMVLAGWVPTHRGLEIAVAARRYVDSRGPVVGPA